MNYIKTMKQALEALTNPAMGYEEHFSAITSLRAAIDAAEKQEPVAWCVAYDDPRMGRIHSNPSMCEPQVDAHVAKCEGRIVKVPLYIHPAPAVPCPKCEEAAEKQEPVAWINQAAAVMSRFIQLTAHPLEDEWGEVAADGIRLLNTNPAPTQSDSAQAKDAARYRHMRNNAQFQFRNGPGLYWYLPRNMSGDEGEQLDSAIDAAMKVGADAEIVKEMK